MSEAYPSETSSGAPWGLAFVIFVIGILSGVCIETYFGTMKMRAKAVEVGAAEWEVNQKNGETTFKWREKAGAP
jgi:hypothetical protein